MSANFSNLFSAVRPTRGFEDIVTQIRQAIEDGQLLPGDRMPNERELCETFGVSRPTLREAIRVLEATGVVEVRRGINGGTFIRTPDTEQVSTALEALLRFNGATIDDLAEFRENFEAETAEWAARRATEEEVKELRAISERMKQAVAVRQSTWMDVVQIDISFHEGVARASHNQIRLAIMLAIHGVLHKSSVMIGHVDSYEWRQQQAQELAGIAEAIANRDDSLARSLMSAHVAQNVEVGLSESTQESESHE